MSSGSTTTTPAAAAPAATPAAPAAAPAAAAPATPATPATAGGTAMIEGSNPGAASAAVAASAVPEKYDFKFPDGFDASALGPIFEKATARMKAAGLSNEHAQAMIDLHVEAMKSNIEGVDELRAGWLEELKADKEVGGEKFEASKTAVRNLFKRVATAEELKEIEDVFYEFGVGNNPALFRVMHRISKAIKEDSLPNTAAAGAGAPQGEADRNKELSTRFPSMYDGEGKYTGGEIASANIGRPRGA